MNITEAQQDMRSAFAGGAPGIFASGIVWVAAGVAAMSQPFRTSFLIFFFGGMFIQPLAILGSKALSRSGAARKDNGFNALAIESTAFLFAGLFVAYVVARINSNWFYPIMLVTIGARYFSFSTIYGNRVFWVLGACLAALGAATLILIKLPPEYVAITGGIIELGFAAIFLLKDRTVQAVA